MPNATSIDECAFESCTALTEVNLPNAISIGRYAFDNCEVLTEVNLPNATSITAFLFNNCFALNEVNVDSATSVEDYGFCACRSLTDITLPNVTGIGTKAFISCINLKTLDFHKAVVIGSEAFANCSSLTRLICRDDTNISQLAQDAFTSGDPLNVSMLKIATGQSLTPTDGYIYIPRVMISTYNAVYTQALGIPDLTPLFRALEDYTVDGTTTGELDESKI